MRKVKIFSVFVISVLLLSCKAYKITQEEVNGTFYKLTKSNGFTTSYTLTLNEDHTFKLLINTAAGKPQCDGKWKLLNNKIIFLKCNEIIDVAEALSSGYMSQREHNLRMLNRNKIEYKGVVLKRIE